MPTRMKLLIISICHDEEDSVAELLDRMPERVDGFDEIERLVVSDGSSDGTARIARDHGADVVEGPTQQRLAFRFEQAIQLALERGADVAVNIDGDLQFRPEDIPLLVEPIVAGRADFVAGDRFSDSQTGAARRPDGMPASKYRANRLGSWVVSRLSAAEFPDVTCGFRAYSRAAMLQLNINNKYTYTQESFQLLAMKKVAIETIPVHVTYHEDRRSRVVTNFWSFLLNSGLNIMRAFRDFAPLRFFFFLGLNLSVNIPFGITFTLQSLSIFSRIKFFRYFDGETTTRAPRDRKSTRLNSSHTDISRMPSSA